MKATYNIFKKNLREACSIYAEESYSTYKTSREPVKFSESFTKRMIKLIKTVEAHHRSLQKEKRRLFFVAALNRAAMILLVAMTITITVTMSVEAARNSILEFLMEFFNDHIRICSMNMDPDGSYDIRTASEEEDDLLEEYVERLKTAGFVLEKEINSNGVKSYTFKRNEKLILSKQGYDNYTVGNIHYSNDSPILESNGISVYKAATGKVYYWHIKECRYQLISYLQADTELELINFLLNE